MNQIEKISDAEMEVMRVIWAMGTPMTSAQFYENLTNDKKWTQSTMLTFLARLTQKGVLTTTKNGKANTYRAVITEDEYRQIETKKFIESVHGGSMKSYLAALFDSKDITKNDIDELKKWFSER